MKFLTLALLLAGFAMNTALFAPDNDAAKERKHQKCAKAGGSIKNGKCMKKGQELQAYSYE